MTTENILMESYCPGQTIADILSTLHNEEKTLLANMGLDAILKMVFSDNYIHADLHGGNIIVHRDGNTYNMAMIDAGLVASLEAIDRRNFIDVFKAVILDRGDTVGQLMIDRNKHKNPDLTPAQQQEFQQEIGRIVHQVHESGLALGRIGVSNILQSLLVACYKYQVKLESKFVSVLLAIGVVEGLGRRLDPDVDILKKAAPYILKAAVV